MQGIPSTDIALSETYRAFATIEAAGQSPTYERLCLGVAGDGELLALLGSLPLAKRQPNLLLGAVRLLSGPIGDYDAFRAWVIAGWTALREQMLVRSTQTNEAARCATLLPVLAALPQPLALIEVGASAGLCLYPDRYGYRYDDRPPIGPADAPITFDCATTGAVPIPAAVPQVVWRAGIDLNPLDVTDADDVRWLQCLIWPEHTARQQRLSGAIEVACADPPLLVRGDLNEAVAELAGKAPTDATLVVFHTAVLAYLDEADRQRFTEQMRDLGGHWISNEGPAVLPQIAAKLPRPAGPGRFVLARDEEPVAFTMPHGQSIEWI